VTISDTYDDDWPWFVWIVNNPYTFSIDKDAHLSSVSDPAGALCGPYTLEFTLTGANG